MKDRRLRANRLGDRPSVRLERADGGMEIVEGTVLGREASADIAGRHGTYRRLTVTIPHGVLVADRQ
ncbi:MAG: hypothetical protein WEG56_10985 [Chloroflexota bacterium]